MLRCLVFFLFRAFLIRRDPENLSVLLIYNNVASNTNLFLFTVFSLLNALGVYIFLLILEWASIGEGR